MARGLSASTIKSWFQYRCERKTRYEMMEAAELAAVPVAKEVREQVWAILGQDYEARVLARLGRQARLVRPPLGEKNGLRDEVAAAFLLGKGDAEYAAQMKLKTRGTPDFLGDGLYARNSLPDLVRRDLSGPAPVFRIIDIKATRGARAFHKTQVAFYALLLEWILKEGGLAGAVDPEGEIWRIPDDGDAEGDRWTAESFALEPYRRLVRDFCRGPLPPIAAKRVEPGVDETFFHVYFKCEQCPYLAHCSRAISPERPAEERDISAVAGLTHEAKRTLLQAGLDSVAKLAAKGAGIGRIDGAGWTLSRRAETLVTRAGALRDGRSGPGTEAQTFLMPPRTDVSIHLVADHDPVDDTLVTLGYLYVHGEEVRERVRVLPTSSRQAEADALVDIFGQVIADLTAIHAHNESRADSDPEALYAHIFVYEPAEAGVLQNAVRRHLEDPRVRTGLLDMVRLFPPDEVVPEPEFRGMQHLPATALRSVVEQLFAIPATVSYDLRQVSGTLAREGQIGKAYSPVEPFERPFSALLALDVSRRLREGRPGAPSVGQIEADVSERLGAAHAVAQWLRDEHARRLEADEAPMLRLRKKPFRLQATFDPLNAEDLDVLRAFELLENRSGLLETLIKLAQRPSVRREAGRAIGPMELLGAEGQGAFMYLTFRAPPEALDAEIGAGAFGLMLSDGEPDLVLEPSLWNGLQCDLLDPRANQPPNVLRVAVFRGRWKQDLFQDVRRRARRDGWWLDQRFLDLNSEKANAFLKFIAEEAAA